MAAIPRDSKATQPSIEDSVMHLRAIALCLGIDHMAPILQSLVCLASVSIVLFSESAKTSPLPSPDEWHSVRDDTLAEAAKVPLRLMPLGTSIVYGVRSSDGNGFRDDLRRLLLQDGYQVDMVGSRKAGSMTDNDNEAWPGFRIEQVEAKARASVPRIQSNLFTVNAGTNDCIQNFDLTHAADRMERMLEFLWQASPRSTIILSTLLINLKKTVEPRVLNLNKQLHDLARHKAAQGRRIILVNMHSPDGPQNGDMSDDGIHPTDSGYLKMARLWHRGIQQAAFESFLRKPN